MNPHTAYGCRRFQLLDAANDAEVGAVYMPTYTGTGTNVLSVGCAGKEIYGRGTAVAPEETKNLGSVKVPPDIPKNASGDALPNSSCTALPRVVKREPNCNTTPCVGDPINIGSGDVFQTIPLFSIDGPGRPLDFKLSFHSTPPNYPSVAHEMGLGWHHSFGARLIPIGIAGEMLYYVDADGMERYFMETVSGTWVSARPIGDGETVVLSGSHRRLQHLDGSYDSFHPDGRWAGFTDRFGNSITAQYDTNLNLTAVVDAMGRTITVVASGRNLQSITLPGGEKWEFSYDVNGNLSAIFDPLHPKVGASPVPWRSFTYGANTSGQYRLLTAVKDEANVVLQSHTYDAQDRGLTSQSSGGRDQVTVEYGSGRRVTHTIDGTRTQVTDFALTVRDSQWVVTSVSGEGCSTCTHGGAQTMQVDDYGRFTRMTDAAGVHTDFSYDAAGNVLTRTEAAGTSLARTTTYAYGNATWKNLMTSETAPGPLGNRVTTNTLAANEQTHTTAVTGRLASGGAPVTYTTTTTFDSSHRLLSVDGPRTDVTDVETREYYPDNDTTLARRGRLKKITAPGNLVTTFDDYDTFGNARWIVDPNGVVTTFITDARGRITATASQPVSGDANESATYTSTTTYDGRDRITQTINPRNIKTGFAYEDGTNRLISTIRYDSSGNQVEQLLLSLNLLGWKTAEYAQVCTSPAPTCLSWSTRRSESFAYDDDGRLITTTHADATSVAYTYDAASRIQTVRDENHATPNTTYGYDALGRLTSVQQTLAGAPGGVVTTSYTYNVQDNLASVTDPNGNVTTYEYDDFGRLIRQVSPVTGTTTYAYDPAGNLTTTTDANAATTTRSYDAANRVLTTTSSRSGSATETVTHAYDDATANAYRRGRLSSMTDPAGSTSYSYDRRGLLRQESKTIQGSTYTTSFGYDANGNRTSITYPSGRVVTYGFDFADRPSTASSGGSSLVSAASYAPFGPMTQMTQGNGAVVARQFDQRYRITQNKLTRTGTTIAQYDYGYDSAGNITSITDSIAQHMVAHVGL